MKRPMISDAFFNPGTIAVIGATKRHGFAYGVAHYLVNNGYRERISLVNPKETEIFGLPVYPDMAAVPGKIDLAIIVIPARAVLQAVKGCIAKGVGAIIIESAGFSEIGSEGVRIEQEIAGILDGTPTRIIGPNCVGVMNPHNGFATTTNNLGAVRPGNIAIVAQSGVFGNILLDWVPSQDIALSKVITIGNRLDVDEVDVLEYLVNDKKTDVIVLYLEGVKDGYRFLKVASNVARIKPIVVLKSGRTEQGRAATASHTGSMSGDDAIYDAVFAQSRIIRASSIQELFDIAKVLATQPIPAKSDLAVVTSSGSLGAMVVDACVKLGMNLPTFSAQTIRNVRENAPGWMNVRNPLDVGPSPLFGPAVQAALDEPAVGSLILIPVVPQMVVENIAGSTMENGIPLWFGNISEIRAQFPEKPVVSFTLGSPEWVRHLQNFFGVDIPILHSPENAARAIYELNRRGKRRR
ncbi:MAG: CoA-binding protein [Deltaproteobacteria bacterium]|nr:CoA-binding protein [Deltaproteobacteria bacterium]